MENEELKTEKKENTIIHKANWALLTLFTILILFNQYQVLGLNDLTGNAIGSFSFGNGDLSDVDVTEIQSTAQGIALLFPLNDI